MLSLIRIAFVHRLFIGPGRFVLGAGKILSLSYCKLPGCSPEPFWWPRNPRPTCVGPVSSCSTDTGLYGYQAAVCVLSGAIPVNLAGMVVIAPISTIFSVETAWSLVWPPLRQEGRGVLSRFAGVRSHLLLSGIAWQVTALWKLGTIQWHAPEHRDRYPGYRNTARSPCSAATWSIPPP